MTRKRHRHRRPTRTDLFLWLFGVATGILATKGSAWAALKTWAEGKAEAQLREHQLRRRVVVHMDTAKIAWMKALRDGGDKLPDWIVDQIEACFDDIAIQVNAGKY